MATRSKQNLVNHPAHYNTGRIEIIDAIEDWKLGFHLGNAIKYVARSDSKKNKIQDLEKAIWYIRREIQKTKWPRLTSKQAQALERKTMLLA